MRAGDYVLLERLGSGGMGSVHLARVETRTADHAPGDLVALKLMHAHLSRRPEFLERSRREARAGRRVRHPNVVRTLDCDVVDIGGEPRCYLVMEYVEGRTLREFLGDLGALPEAMLLELALQAAEGLAAIHEGGIVHRDVKPDNILVTGEGRVRIMDLGVARFVEESMALTADGVFMGSFPYASPEQFRGGSVGTASDLYSLGVLLYELAAGGNPFRLDSVAAVIHAHLEVTPPDLHELTGIISPFFAEVIASLLEKEPARRPASAKALAAILRDGKASRWWRRREVARRTARARRPEVLVRRETSLRGRDAALATLCRIWERARAGTGAVALVEGEAGIGKTRLVDAFLDGIQPEETHILYGSYPPSGGLGGLSDAILDAFGEARLESRLRPYLRTNPSLATPFAALLKHEPTPGAELRGDVLVGLFVQLLHGLGATRPTVWVVEDLHFAPGDSLGLLLTLARAVAGRPVLLVLTVRPGLAPETLAHLVRLEHLERICLERLTKDAVTDLLREALADDALVGRLADRIADRSDGIPYFVFELIRGLRESGTDDLGNLTVPSAIRDLLGARLKELSREERAILEVGAVQGYEFEPDLIARALGRGKVTVLQDLAEMERRSGVVRSTGHLYRFDHHQLLEVVYEDLSESLRREIHALVAEARIASERDAGRPADTLSGETALFVATHHLLGSRPQEAMSVLVVALEHLRLSHRNLAAIDLARRALAVPGGLAGASRAEVLLRLHDPLDLLGRRDEERSVIDEALRLAEEDGGVDLRIRANRRMGQHLHRVADYGAALRSYREAHRLARETERRVDEAALVGCMGTVLADRGRLEESREHHERHLRMAREIGDRLEEARATGNLAVYAYETGRYDEALTRYAACREIFRDLGERRSEAIATNGMGVALHDLGRNREAREHFEQHLTLCREIGYRRGEAMALGNLGLIDLAEGRYRDARDLFQRDLDIQREIGDPAQESLALVYVASLRRRLGDMEGSRRFAERALEIATEIEFHYGASGARRALASVRQEQGRFGEARALIEETLETDRRLGAVAAIADDLVSHGLCDHRDGRADDARRAFEEALEIADESVQPRVLVARVFLSPSETTEIRALVDRHGAALSADDRILVDDRLWRVDGDRADLERAHERLARIMEDAPEESRGEMLRNVTLFRIVEQAWRSGA